MSPNTLAGDYNRRLLALTVFSRRRAAGFCRVALREASRSRRSISREPALTQRKPNPWSLRKAQARLGIRQRDERSRDTASSAVSTRRTRSGARRSTPNPNRGALHGTLAAMSALMRLLQNNAEWAAQMIGRDP